MTDTNPTWTDDRVETLKKLWAEGHTASVIADRLRGVTRNAVIGKVCRLGLPGRIITTKIARKTPPKKVRKMPEREPPKIKLIPTWQALPMPKERPRPATLYTLADRPDNGCMYFYGDPLKDNRGYCGKPREPGIAYCGECARICFDVRTPNERTRARQEREKVAA